VPKLRSDDLVWQVIDDEIVVLDTRASAYLGLKGSGALLWRELESDVSDERLVEVLVQRYGIAADTAQKDVAAFLDKLEQRGLLSR
jgi:hypothetical protein